METYERGKLDGQMLQELKDINAKLVGIGTSISGQDTRIRVLENWRWYMLGACAVIGVLAAKITHAALSLL